MFSPVDSPSRISPQIEPALSSYMRQMYAPSLSVTLSPSRSPARSPVDLGSAPEMRHRRKRVHRTEDNLGGSGSSSPSSSSSSSNLSSILLHKPSRSDTDSMLDISSPKRMRTLTGERAGMDQQQLSPMTASSYLQPPVDTSEMLTNPTPTVLPTHMGMPMELTRQSLSRFPSSKDSTRIFALMWLCSGYLPTSKPEWVPRPLWEFLLQQRELGTLVQIVTFGRGILTLRFPEVYDVIVHSRAIYGPALRKWTKSLKTRFRWWSDNSVKQFHPIKNSRISETHLERIITLPLEITEHPYLQGLFREGGDHQKLLNEISDFFANLLHGWLNREDIEVLDLLGFGRTRRKLQVRYNDADRGFDDVLRFSIAEWNQKIPTSLPLPSVNDVPIC